MGLRLSVTACLTICAALPAAAQGGPITIFAGRVLDGKGGNVRNATVVVDRGRILRIEPRRVESPTFSFPSGTLMPGLIDAHVHLTAHLTADGRMHVPGDGETPEQATLAAAANAHRTLMAGFTTVASIGAAGDLPLRAAIARGDLPGPRVLTSLEPIADPSLSPDQLKDQVRERVDRGADLIKVIASKSIRDGGTPTLSQAQLDAVCGEARAASVPVIVHAHDTASVRAAASAGCGQITHGLFATDGELDLLAERGAYFDPQCSLVFRNYLGNRRWFLGLGNITEEGFAAMERAAPLAIAVTRNATARSGLKVVYGTDAVAGAHGKNADDLVCRVRQAGQRPMDALVDATSTNAEALGIARETGSVAPGLAADLIVVAGNPLDDIDAMKRVVFVMRSGLVYRHDPTLAGNPSLQ